MTQVDNIAYVVCAGFSAIAMYTADTFSPLGDDIHVKGMKNPRDIVACRRDRQLYVADDYCIWRVSTDDHSYEKWLTTELHINKLSLMSHGLLVTSSQPPTLCEYNTVDAQLLRVIKLSQSVEYLWHGLETSRGTFVVSHKGTSHDKEQCAVSELFSIVVYIGTFTTLRSAVDPLQ